MMTFSTDGGPSAGSSSPNQQFLGEKLGKEMVSIYVGPKRKEFIIHKELICESNFFRGAFINSFAEAQDGTMYLPEDNPAAFDLYVEWVYRKQIPAGHSESYLHNLYDLYIMAEKFCNVTLKDIVMDAVQDLAKKHDLLDAMFARDQVLKVFNNTSDEGEGLCLFLIHLICYAFITRMDNKRDSGGKGKLISKFGSGDLELMWEMIKENKTIFMQIQDLMLANIRGPWNRTILDPRVRNDEETCSLCQFHTHDEDLKCRESKLDFPVGFLLDVTNVSEDLDKERGRGASLRSQTETLAERLFEVSRVFSSISNWKVKQEHSWVFETNKQDGMLKMYNEHSELVFELSPQDIKEVTYDAARKCCIHLNQGPLRDVLGISIWIEFGGVLECTDFCGDLRDTQPALNTRYVHPSNFMRGFNAALVKVSRTQ
ncbi:hypothetical protein VTL71DRAFT_12063 [Oculimacula yallundae]|uniref:BTB domain-containing protein n=1 Tax=Oculimacula yallundae TaxID=86028 RepID=A0ABR4CRY1_9HELO